MSTMIDLEAQEEQRIARYFAASPEERTQMREAYVAQVAGELAMAKIAFEAEE